jgi:gliding motility-associated-like protein
MQEKSCVQDGQTINTYKCLPPGNYYVQVFTPAAVNGYVVTGTIDLVATVQPHQDSCSAINPCLATSRFTPQFDCNTNDSVKCYNFSTYGYNIVYNWNGGYNNQVSSALAPSFYYPRLSHDSSYVIRLITNNTACGGRDTFRLTMNIPARPSLHLIDDTALCTHQSIGIDAGGFPGCTYLWNDGSTGSSYVAHEQNEGDYLYKVKVDYNGCFVTDSVGIRFKKSPNVEIHKSNDINCVIGRAFLVAEGAMTYSWDPANYLNNPNVPKTIASPVTTTTYRVIGSNPNGCKDTAYIPLNVNLSDGADAFGVPNAFTPNGDGVNDCFGVSYWGRVNNFSLNVYDRWGRRLFHSTNPSDCWDGKWKGKEQDNGSYIYDLKGEGACGPVSRKGNLLLIR